MDHLSGFHLLKASPILDDYAEAVKSEYQEAMERLALLKEAKQARKGLARREKLGGLIIRLGQRVAAPQKAPKFS